MGSKLNLIYLPNDSIKLIIFYILLKFSNLFETFFVVVINLKLKKYISKFEVFSWSLKPS